METKFISRRDLLKGTGVLIVSFSFFGRVSNALAQGDGLSVDGMDPTVLDSWMAIARDGTVEHLKVLEGHPLLVNAATDAVSRWRYQPTLLNGEPVEVETEVVVNFILGER